MKRSRYASIKLVLSLLLPSCGEQARPCSQDSVLCDGDDHDQGAVLSPDSRSDAGWPTPNAVPPDAAGALPVPPAPTPSAGQATSATDQIAPSMVTLPVAKCFRDEDGDGEGAGPPVDCTAGDGAQSLAASATDCDDKNQAKASRRAELCDGLDNDCDGMVDEDVLNACGHCGPAPKEVCDSLDNDCDGMVDEDVLNACGQCGPVPREVCDGVDNDCDEMVDEDVLNACGQCGPAPTEVCDGVDNDCDGTVDDDVANACGQCGPVPAEVCDGVDNDCDGTADEDTLNPCGGACTGPEPEPNSFCWTHTECSQPGTGYVVCVDGHSVCSDDYTTGWIWICP